MQVIDLQNIRSNQRLSLMGFAVYHTEKGKTSSGGIGNHIDRKVGAEHSYRHADPERRHLNQIYHVNDYCKKPLHQAIEARIKEGYKAKKGIRSDAVKYQTHVVTGTHEDMLRIFSKKETAEAWVKANYAFMVREFGKENIVRFVLHRDERTPHVHAVTVPLTKDGRLSAKEVMGNRKDMQERQDRYADAMKIFGLDRGIRNTGIKHESAKEYYARMEDSLIIGNSNEIKASKNILGSYTKESVLELENSVKSLKTALKSKDEELKRKGTVIKNFEHYQSDRLDNLKKRNEQLAEAREKLLIDPNYREQIFAQRFEKALGEIVKEVQRNARTRGIDKVQVVDEAIRKHMKEVDPKRNVWEILDTYSGGRRVQVENALGEKFEETQKRGMSRGLKR